MSGRLLIHTTSAKGKSVNDVNFLAVWREESGRWRLLDWQAAKNPAPVAATNYHDSSYFIRDDRLSW